MQKAAKRTAKQADTGRWIPFRAARSESEMHNKTQNGNGRKSASLTPDDVFGMFEAGLAELSMHFAFDAVNTADGVQLEIDGLERIEHDDGSWSLRIRTEPEGEDAQDESGDDV
jgi:hypothetical protein